MAAQSAFSPSTIARVLAAKRAGKSNGDACRDAGIARATLYRWIDQDADFASAFAAARSAYLGERREEKRRAMGLTCDVSSLALGRKSPMTQTFAAA